VPEGKEIVMHGGLPRGEASWADPRGRAPTRTAKAQKVQVPSTDVDGGGGWGANIGTRRNPLEKGGNDDL